MAIGLMGLSAACGRAKTEAPEVAEESAGSERPREPEDQLAIEGLRGTLSQEEIQRALEPRMPKFGRCIQKRAGDVEWLAGGMVLTFRVATDGSVASVYPSESTLGDRATEQCAVDVAKGTRFPQPHGGEAEFSWSFDVPLDSEIRPPVAWGDAEAGALVTSHGSEITAQCGSFAYGITAYVDTDGRVVAAGAATSAEEGAGQLDCVAEAVRSWTFPSPGSYPAKVRFSIE